MEQVVNETEQRRAMYEAFNRETSEHTRKFRDYYRGQLEQWREAVLLVRSVIDGKTVVSDEVIENCRGAVMRLHQTGYVLGQMMLPIGSPSPDVLGAVMDILQRIEGDTAQATKNLTTIYGWQAAARSTM